MVAPYIDVTIEYHCGGEKKRRAKRVAAPPRQKVIGKPAAKRIKTQQSRNIVAIIGLGIGNTVRILFILFHDGDNVTYENSYTLEK